MGSAGLSVKVLVAVLALQASSPFDNDRHSAMTLAAQASATSTSALENLSASTVQCEGLQADGFSQATICFCGVETSVSLAFATPSGTGTPYSSFYIASKSCAYYLQVLR